MKTTTNIHYPVGNRTSRRRLRGANCEKRIRSLIEAACATRASTARMTLQDWIEVEHEVKRGLQHEY